MSDYRFGIVRADGRSPAEVVGAVRTLRPWLALVGGLGIGFASDEFPVISAADSGGIAAPTVGAVETMMATARPADPTPPELHGGVVALRQFHTGDSDAPEFVELSAAAWPAFEDLYEARILGLFRASEAPPGTARFLLATWYASFAEWERSRGLVHARGEDATEATRRFQRRQQLTTWTVVRVGIPVPAA